MSRIILIDNYDSFAYNLVHFLRDISTVQIDVVRNDKFELSELEKYDRILLSPGPGLPSESGKLCDVIREYADKKPILGVCLGHQAIAEVFGSTLKNLNEVLHGKVRDSELQVDNEVLFDGFPKNFQCGRYHSWVVDNVSEDLEVTAVDADGEVMALRHKSFDVKGMQFHPESVLTPEGGKILENWVQLEDKR